MTGPSLLTAAVDELYAAPLAEFVARRKALAAAAKKAGDRVAATAIGALRKPSLSADTVNRLVHGAPTEVDELLQLGADLRTAEQALDAGELRRLGDRRRRLVHDLAELAFELTGQTSPSAAVRDEVTATLNAALADEEVAQRLSSGALVTQARWDGFGSTQLPELAASMADLPLARLQRVATAPSRERTASPSRAASQTKAAPTKPASPPKAAAPTKAAPAERDERDDSASTPTKPTEQQRARDRRAAAKLAQEQKAAAAQQAAQEAARQAAAQEAAEAAAEAAERAAAAQELVSTIDRRIGELNLQLAHQRQLLADAQRALKGAENERRLTALAATRAGAPTR